MSVRKRKYGLRKVINGKVTYISRYIIEQKLGRKLASDEIVHHKDGNVENNNIENLELMSKYDHDSLHCCQKPTFTGARARKISNDPNLAWCVTCQKFLNKEEFYKNPRHWNGLYEECKNCAIERSRKWRLKVKNAYQELAQRDQN